jgi:hypothetical protein
MLPVIEVDRMRRILTFACSVVLSGCFSDELKSPGSGAGGSTSPGGSFASSGGATSVATNPPASGAASAAGTTAAAGQSAVGGASSGIGGATSSSAGGIPMNAAGASGAIGAPPGGAGGSAGVTSAPGGAAGAGGGGGTPEKQQLAVTADFLNKTLSVVDLAKLTDGAKREDALVGTVDLSKYAPGPLDLAITPDGKTALVAISGGWLSAFTTVPAGNGTLVFVDIATRTVLGELYTGASPMGIAITRDGKRAFVGQYGETYFASVDIEKRTFDRIQTGAQFNEELAIDDTGSVGILSYGPAGNCVTFSVDNPAAQMGATLALSGDAGGTAFFPGTKLAYVVQAPTPLTGNVGGHDVIDATNPKAPVASDDVRVPTSPTWYRVTAVAPRKSVAFPSTQNGQLSVVEMKLQGNVAQQVQSVPVGAAQSLAYGINADSTGRVLVAVAEEHYVAVVDLNTAKSIIVPWNLSATGPTDVVVVP